MDICRGTTEFLVTPLNESNVEAVKTAWCTRPGCQLPTSFHAGWIGRSLRCMRRYLVGPTPAAAANCARWSIVPPLISAVNYHSCVVPELPSCVGQMYVGRLVSANNQIQTDKLLLTFILITSSIPSPSLFHSRLKTFLFCKSSPP